MIDRAVGAVEGMPYGRALALVTAIGAVLRLGLIARQPVGLDEDFTAVAVHQPVGRMIDIVAHDSAPPLFYLLERAVVALADALGLASLGGLGGPVALRLVPTLAGIALIPLLAALARRVGGDSVALWTAAFTALIPTTVMLSGFARMYGLAATLTAAAALLLWRAVERPSPARWGAYLLAAAASVWTVYFAALALAGILAAAVWLRPRRRTAASALLATGLAVATLAPWLVAAQAQFEHAGGGFWVLSETVSTVGGTLSQLFMGPPVDLSVPFAPILIGLQDATVVAGFGCLVWGLRAWRGLDSGRRNAAAFCLIATAGVAVLAVVTLWRPLLDARYADVMWLPLFALVGLGLVSMPRRVAGAVVAVGLIATLALGTAITHSATSYLVPELDAGVGGSDAVLAPWSHYLVLLDEADPAVQARLHVLDPNPLPWYVGTAAYPPGAQVYSIPADAIANRGRIFWIADPGIGLTGLPPDYRQQSVSCSVLACLTIYGPAGP
jgi:4-amino-4-deoxy-L-arabinose transferase-like glycosyltransferase